MFREMERFGKDPNVVVRSKTTFNDPLKWIDPAYVFTCSWSDFFHEDVSIAWLDDAWDIIRKTPHLTYQILTKRPEEIMDCLPEDWGDGWDNVWLGVTIENEDNIWRMESLLEVDAKLYFVSYEPALGSIAHKLYSYWHKIGWLISGGESGPNARPANPDWFREVRDLCEIRKIPYFHKQAGGSIKIDGTWGGDTLDGKQYHEFPVARRIA
jgi:protein gp37